ncbi:MAG: hypothetical protein FJ189_07450 [Gammaproteobacteria bacterium]|nr:hypothetical protein [Gammaproteobacteria bacterium]
MHELIEGLLALARLQSGPQRIAPACVHIAKLLHGICEEAQVLFGFHPSLTVEIDPEWDLLGDGNELRSAFSNLIINAMKYTPADGQVAVGWSGNAEGACLVVQDNGPGIAPEHLSRLTERFYRVEVDGCRSRNGSGLGLSIVKHVLNRHDATLEIDSVVGKGSRFVCCFPDKRVIALRAEDPHQSPAAVHDAAGDQPDAGTAVP